VVALMIHAAFFIFTICVIYIYCKSELVKIEAKRREEFKRLERKPSDYDETDENYVSELYMLNECADNSDMDYLH
jgi:hypothetical protein